VITRKLVGILTDHCSQFWTPNTTVLQDGDSCQISKRMDPGAATLRFRGFTPLSVVILP
jgi:hypothetical protein